jgi:hypothetical protein
LRREPTIGIRAEGFSIFEDAGGKHRAIDSEAFESHDDHDQADGAKECTVKIAGAKEHCKTTLVGYLGSMSEEADGIGTWGIPVTGEIWRDFNPGLFEVSALWNDGKQPG